MRILSLAWCFILITMNAMSQSKEQKVKKGYYSIGNNSEIIAEIDRANVIQQGYVPDPYSQSPKGYYSPEANRKKIPWRKMRGETRGFLVPVITKGYYSIGNNALQLKK
ncbi:MAG: hypothetical protein EOO01_26320 [Chitinophagaceae bacterium]|nr:MAG: hypothetical protein EOO01_26320 [Chitinophagaceae bacterium]